MTTSNRFLQKSRGVPSIGLWLLSVSGVIVSAAAAGNVEHGKQLYETRCMACHALDSNREGPAHRGVFGRQAGAVLTFNYSKAVKNSGVIWNEKTLDLWLTNPEQFIPGQEMGFSVPDANDRADIISYLRSLSPNKQSVDKQSANN